MACLTLLGQGLLLASPALPATDQVFRLTLKENFFYPSRIEVPANTKFRLVITNYDSIAEEFDSFDLNREKVIFPGKSATIYVGPLEPGSYEFFGEYNPRSARGILIAIDKPSGAANVD